MMREETPTIEQARHAYCDGLSGTSRTRAESIAEFDRMIAEVEREAAARALEEAASWMQDGVGEAYNPSETDYAQQKREAKARRAWLRARAAEYRKAVLS